MKVFGVTNTGLVRELNEDNYFVSNEPIGSLQNLFIIADGMGGQNAGEVASKLAIDEFINYTNRNVDTSDSIGERFIKGIEYTNNVIYNNAKYNVEYRGMGTTFVVCTVVDETLYIANVGDSRLYIYDDTLKQITIDHSYVEELVRAGQITRNESITHPDRNIITRALGTYKDIEVDVFKINVERVSKILLCSDGLTNMLVDDRINEIISSDKDLDLQGDQLLEESLQKGGTDNITFIIIDMNEMGCK